MPPSPPSVSDPFRLEALARYAVLDTPPEEGFDDIARLAAGVCGAGTALVSLVAADRQWFKARVGFEACETPIAQSVCAHALAEPELLVIPDLREDARTRDNALVTGEPFVRFYAGAVLRAVEGQAIGTLCVLDPAPRPQGLDAEQAAALVALARQVVHLLELRRAVAERDAALALQREAEAQARADAAALRDNALRLSLAVEATDIGIYDYDVATGALRWDARTRELFGLTGEAPLTYNGDFLGGLHPDDRDRADEAVRAALDPAGPGVFACDYRTLSPRDGRLRWVSARGKLLVESGRAARLIGTVRDITAAREAEEAIAATLERYRMVGRATKDVIWDWDLVHDHVLWNDALTDAYGYALADVVPSGAWWLERIHPEDRAKVGDDIRRVIAGNQADWSHEYRFLRADGGFADVLDRGYMVRDSKGAPLRMIGAMLDLTERKRAEEEQRLLALEVSHRMKNVLTMVQAIASQTLRSAPDMATANAALGQRLLALAKAQEALIGGPLGRSNMQRAISDALSPLDNPPGRIAISGPPVEIGGQTALSLALMMHELGTNAAKYGALSDGAGSVTVAWTIVAGGGEPRLRLSWSERGGPPVSPPKRRGFGSRMIERSLAARVQGTVTIDYAPKGLACTLEAPLSAISDPS